MSNVPAIQQHTTCLPFRHHCSAGPIECDAGPPLRKAVLAPLCLPTRSIPHPDRGIRATVPVARDKNGEDGCSLIHPLAATVGPDICFTPRNNPPKKRTVRKSRHVTDAAPSGPMPLARRANCMPQRPAVRHRWTSCVAAVEAVHDVCDRSKANEEM